MAPLSTATYGTTPDATMAAALGIPAGTPIDGAVAELTDHGDGTITAEIRIPAPAV
jgi:hypothetical protein